MKDYERITTIEVVVPRAKQPGERIRGGIVPQPGATCDSCGKPAQVACSCRCGAAACRQCIKEGRVG